MCSNLQLQTRTEKSAKLEKLRLEASERHSALEEAAEGTDVSTRLTETII